MSIWPRSTPSFLIFNIFYLSVHLSIHLSIHPSIIYLSVYLGLLHGPSGKESIFQCRRHKRPEFDPLVRKIPPEENVETHSSQHSCLENPVNGGAWRATVRGVTESDPSGMNKQTSSHACIISLSITCLLSIYLSIAHHASVSIHIPHPSVSATYVASTYLHLLPKSLQSCPTLCDPVDCSPPGSSVRGTLQARVLEWVCHALLQGVFPAQGSNQVSCTTALQILYR